MTDSMTATAAPAEITNRTASVREVAETFRWTGNAWTGRGAYVLVTVRGYGANPQLILEEQTFEVATIAEGLALAEQHATPLAAFYGEGA